jgi:two-component system response regulator PilR (NtrC family)
MSHRILIVEDDEGVRGLLREILRRNGYEVETAGGLEEARELLHNRSYSLVFTDLRLGGANGLEGFDILQQIRRTSPMTRTVILTGGADAEMERRALDQRADAFLRKPVGMREIGALAAQLLGAAPLIA